MHRYFRAELPQALIMELSLILKDNVMSIHNFTVNSDTREGIPLKCFGVFRVVIVIYGNAYWEKILLRGMHHLINNMDHMCISVTEPSSVIRSKIKVV